MHREKLNKNETTSLFYEYNNIQDILRDRNHIFIIYDDIKENWFILKRFKSKETSKRRFS